MSIRSSDKEPIDSHTCHCSVCKRVTGQPTTHVVFFKHDDLAVDNAGDLNRQPFNDQNHDGPLELCTCETCGAPIMLDDKQHRIRVIVPNLMGHDAAKMPATYHAFFDPAKGEPSPRTAARSTKGCAPISRCPPAPEGERSAKGRARKRHPKLSCKGPASAGPL